MVRLILFIKSIKISTGLIWYSRSICDVDNRESSNRGVRYFSSENREFHKRYFLIVATLTNGKIQVIDGDCFLASYGEIYVAKRNGGLNRKGSFIRGSGVELHRGKRRGENEDNEEY